MATNSMPSDRWPEIEALFRAAHDSPPHRRADVLAQAEPDVRREVESLLAERDREGPLDGLAVDLLESGSGETSRDGLTAPVMRLTPGSHLGPYEIVSRLGAGGMGEVYRARDLRLGREVAVKVLASGHVDDDQQARFEREARVISSLNHPHICTLYDVGIAEGITYLVMELLEGETLASRLARGALPVALAVRYAIDIADALGAAHRHRVTHRDVKPGNIMLTRAGAKLLDFGLAKHTSIVAASDDGPVTGSDHVTVETSMLGTRHYMAPEQIVGRPVDARADIFALGTVMFEMVTGKKLFQGQSETGLFTAILERDPLSLSSLAPDVPPALEWTVLRCLAKHPDERWQDAGDLASALRLLSLPAPVVSRSDNGRRVTWALMAIGVLATLLSGVFLWEPGQASRSAPSGEHPVTFNVDAPEGSIFPIATMAPHPALSLDGRRFAFVAPLRRDARGQSVVWVQTLGSLQAQPLTGTARAEFPFWSPDGRSVAFGAAGQLKRIAATGGGAPQNLAAADDYWGGTWARNDTIVFAATTGLFRVSSSGGEVRRLTRIDDARGEFSHRYPVMLSDGTRFLYLVLSTQEEHQGLYLGSLAEPEVKQRVVATDANGAFGTGPDGREYLFFVRDFSLLAQPFDSRRGELTGDPAVVARPIEPGQGGRLAAFAVSDRVLLHRPRFRPQTRLVWVDRKGATQETIGVEGHRYRYPSLSPDGTKVAVTRLERETDIEDIWWIDLRRRQASERLTTDPISAAYPAWTPDSNRVIFSAMRPSSWGLYWRPITGRADPDPLLTGPTPFVKRLRDVTRDGRFLLFEDSFDLWVLPLTAERQPYPLMRTPFRETHGRVSPDGRWLAFTSSETGELQVYVTTFPVPTRKVRISTAGGSDPQWRGDGRELYYVASDNTLMAVAAPSRAWFEPAIPEPLFRKSFDTVSLTFSSAYAPDVDGQRFLVTETVEGDRPRLIVTLNWTTNQ